MESSTSISRLDKSKLFGRSFGKVLKGLGPSRDPCGMPEKVFVVVELKTSMQQPEARSLRGRS